MLKYVEYSIVFEEVPNEVTLALNISNCPCGCIGCSEAYLKKDVGQELTIELLDNLIKDKDITCVCFMGGDNDHKSVIELCKHIKDKYKLKTAMYSGFDYIDIDLVPYLDYYKVGRWIMPDISNPDDLKNHSWGPIVWPVSNQLMFKIVNNKLINITNEFRKKPINNWLRYIIK